MGEFQLFDINEFINTHKVNEDTLRTEKASLTFVQVCDLIKERIDDDMQGLSDAEKQEKQELEHQATLGSKRAEKLIIPSIEKIIRDNNLDQTSYPNFFDSLAHAVYHEIYGFGVFYKWEKEYPDSPSAKIIGKELWFKDKGEFIKQKEEFRSDDHIYEIFRALEVSNRGFKLNEANPRGEIQLHDGTRVTVAIPPAVSVPEIVFRRFVVSNFSFEEQARRGTLPVDDINFYKGLSNLYLNTVIAGLVESGKSTMLKTFYGARDKDKVAILIETSPETFLKRDFPDRLVHDFYTLGDIEATIRHALRVDHDYLIFQEVRGNEAEGAIQAMQRGSRGLLMTYHITDPARMAEQLAEHILDEFSNRERANEVRRISKQLDIGITMANFKGNKKRITSIYEICYDEQEDKAWINYLVKYAEKEDKWYYNSDVSDKLKEKMLSYNEEVANEVLIHLSKQAKLNPIIGQTKEYTKIE